MSVDDNQHGGIHTDGDSGTPPSNLEAMAAAVGEAVSASLRPLLQGKVTEGSMDGGRKRKGTEGPEFRFKGNKLQFEFNNRVLSNIGRIGRLLSEDGLVEDSISKSLDLVEAAKDLVTERNKLIRLADRSIHGWSTVDEYLSDELASDSDDEKRIRAAEERAGRKKRAVVGRRPFRGAALRGRGGYWQGEAPFVNWGYQNKGNRFAPSAQGYQGGPFSQAVDPSQGPMWGGAFAFQGNARGSSGRGRGACFKCGAFDHWAKLCPADQSQSSSQQNG